MPQIGQLPQNVLVKFHDPRVGRISRVSVEGDAEAVPIEPVTAKFYGREGVTRQRTQLPLLPCWAATIHKLSVKLCVLLKLDFNIVFIVNVYGIALSFVFVLQ